MLFDEEAYIVEIQRQRVELFLQEMASIDREYGALLEKEGWTYKETAQRWVLFTFGEVLLTRRCYTKEGQRCYPVDEYLGLKPYSRQSQGLLYKLATTVVDMTERKAAQHFQELLHLNVSRDVVRKARKMATELYKERDAYRFYEDDTIIEKVKVDILYLEGDGIRLATPNAEDGTRQTDFSHFLIHEGMEEEYANRDKAVNKHEIWAESNKIARQQVLDYLHNHYEITKDTLIITNSDMGAGYTPYVFEEIVQAFQCRHEHFWDRYHLKKEIRDLFRTLDKALEIELLEAIKLHSKKDARRILEEALEMLDPQEERLIEAMEKFKRRLMRNFAYTKPPEMRGVPTGGIGIMESNHTKLAYRMKKQAKHWSVQGALTMGRMILDKLEGNLHDLFFGEWREEYQKYKSIDEQSVSSYLRKVPQSYKGVRQVVQANKSGRRRF